MNQTPEHGAHVSSIHLTAPPPPPRRPALSYLPLRVSRDRTEGSEEEWKDRDQMGPRQWDRMTEAFNTDFKDCETVLLGTPTPLVLISQG